MNFLSRIATFSHLLGSSGVELGKSAVFHFGEFFGSTLKSVHLSGIMTTISSRLKRLCRVKIIIDDEWIGRVSTCWR